MIQESTITPVQHFFDNFCERISEEQGLLLKSGTPDVATRAQLVELVLGLVTTVSINVVTALENRKTLGSQGEAVTNINQVVPHICTKTLIFQDKVNNVPSHCLATLNAKEVRDNISSTIFRGPMSPPLDINQRILNPFRLNAMVLHASNMSEKLKSRMRSLFLS